MFSAQHRLNLSLSTKNLWLDPIYREKNRMSRIGKKLSESHKLKLKEARRRFLSSVKAVEYRENARLRRLGKRPWNWEFLYSEEINQRRREKAIATLQSRNLKMDTSIELKMKRELDKLGIDYVHPYNFNKRFLCDFAIPLSKVIIECDGDYWHNREDIAKKDKAENAYIAACGWRLLRFWQHEINDSIEDCVDKILSELKVEKS